LLSSGGNFRIVVSTYPGGTTGGVYNTPSQEGPKKWVIITTGGVYNTPSQEGPKKWVNITTGGVYDTPSQERPKGG